MKAPTPFCVLLVTGVSAFPHVGEIDPAVLSKLVSNLDAGTLNERAGPSINPTFNASQQYVSTSGDHIFVSLDIKMSSNRGNQQPADLLNS